MPLPDGKLAKEADRPKRLKTVPLLVDPPSHEWTDQRCFVEALIYRQTFHCLIDTGAARSFINTNVAEILRNANGPTHPIHSVVQVADGREIILRQEFRIPCTIKGITHQINVIEFPQLAEEIIFGIDALTLMNLSIQINGHEVMPQRQLRTSQNGHNSNVPIPLHGIADFMKKNNLKNF